MRISDWSSDVCSSDLPESPLTHHPRTLDSPELLQVKCTQVTATAYGLVRLVLKDDDPPVSVAVRPDLIVAVLDVGEGMTVGLLLDLDSNPAVPPACQEKRQVLYILRVEWVDSGGIEATTDSTLQAFLIVYSGLLQF